MKINAQTRVSEIIKSNTQAIDALVSVSPKFSKLKNPLLRKVMAPRVNLQQAARIGGVRVDDLFIVLMPLGFEIDQAKEDLNIERAEEEVPAFARNIQDADVFMIDVRPLIRSGKDPLSYILSRGKEVRDGQPFCIVNTFEPIPLIQLLEKKGFESFVRYIDTDEVNTYFYKDPSAGTSASKEEQAETSVPCEDFNELLNANKENRIETDVRNLEMPLPMLTILELLETLPKEKILYVHHKRVPVYLLPELESRGFEYFINEISDEEVKLIIRHRL